MNSKKVVKPKKEKNENQKRKKIITKIILIVLIIIFMLFIIFIRNMFKPSTTEKNSIVATKMEERNGNKIQIEYEIEIQNYDFKSAIKTMSFETKDLAQSEYEYYEFINKYERRNIGLELKGKKLILTMPEEQFIEDIGYNIENNTIFVTSSEERKEVINQDALKEALQLQGYTIK